MSIVETTDKKFPLKSYKREYFFLTLVYVISRWIFYSTGVQFDGGPVNYFIQYIDPVYLVNNLAESLFFLHAQPPLFNLFIGLILKAFPYEYPSAFQCIFLLIGYLFTHTLFYLMVILKVERRVAFVLTALFIISPQVIIYENLPFYAYTIIFQLCVGGMCLYISVKKKSFMWMAAYFVVIGSIVLSHSMFHMIWYLCSIIMLLIFKILNPRKIILASFLPLMLIFLIYAKNNALVGFFSTSSSWQGHQLAYVSIQGLSHEQRNEALKKADMSIYRILSIVNNYPRNHPVYKDWDIQPTGVAVLDDFYKPSSGNRNWNSMFAVKRSKWHLETAKYFLMNYPLENIKRFFISFTFYFTPGPTDGVFINRTAISDYENIYNFMFAHLNKINDHKLYDQYLVNPHRSIAIKSDTLSLVLFFLIIAFNIFLLLFGTLKLILLLKNNGENTAASMVLLFVLFNIVYISMFANCFGYMSTSRYRFYIEPFMVILLGMFLTSVYNRITSILKK